MNELTDDFQKLIDDFNKLKIKERSGLTFLEIAKCPHIENVWSNILAFYFDPNNEHNLHDLLLKSLFEAAEIEVPPFNNVKVDREHKTEKNNRIDIVIISDDFALGIENKVGADLYNDLNDYSNTIDQKQKEFKYKIVLSKYKSTPAYGFKSVLYSKFIKNIKSNIGYFTDYSDTKHLIFLLDFLKNIENNINSNIMSDNPAVVEFFFNNRANVRRFFDYYNKFNQSFDDRFANIHNLINIGKNDSIEDCGLFLDDDKTPVFKYKITIQHVVVFYQVTIASDVNGRFGFHSHYWIDGHKFPDILEMLKKNVHNGTDFKYKNLDNNIADKIMNQIDSIICLLEEVIKNQ